MKKFICVIVIIVAVFVSGCSGSDSGTNSDTSNTPKNESIKIEDLDWTVEEGISNGDRNVVFNYTNNSKYTVVDFSIKFVLKDDVTDDQLKVFDDVKKDAGWNDEEIKNVYISGYNHKISDVGETLKGSPCGYNGTYRRVTDINQYNLMKPDIATIAYIYGNKIYLTYYDFKTKEYTEDSNSGTEAFTWPTSDIAKLLPKPKLKVGQLRTNDDNEFYFGGFGVTKDFFNDYVNQCKEKGFTVDSDSSSMSYTAKNSDSYELEIYYNKNDEQMTINIKKPE